MEHLKGLNDKQKEAAVHKDGPLLIIAGAGAGKTKTITHRIVNLIKQGVAPDKILAVTFTNKAAKEMREKILAEIEKSAQGQDSIPFVSTFHSLGVHIIKENARILGLTRYFTILDSDDTKSLIKEALKELNFDPKEQNPGKIGAIISIEKGKFTTLESYKEKVGSSFQDLVAKVWKIYEEKKAQENSLDFDDLILKSVKLLQDNENVRKYYQDKWHYIHIDEYQDTNEVQYLMSKLLSGENKNIAVVGDADQNIYSWRGANLKNILSFEKDYPNSTIVTLEENYRSTQNILEAANEIIKKNVYRPEKNLFTKNKTGEKISLCEALDENDEADFVATKILELIDADSSSARSHKNSTEFFAQDYEPSLSVKPRRGESAAQKTQHLEENSAGDGLGPKNFIPNAKFSEIAVLYRANFQSRALEEAMLRYNIPYQVLGIKFFERREIKDTLAYLRAALNKDSLSDIKRIINFPKRGIGKATLVKMFAAAQAGQAGEIESLPIKTRIKINSFYELLEEIAEQIKKLPASQAIKFVVKKSGIEDELQAGGEEEMERLANIKELATLALKYDPPAEAMPAALRAGNLANGAGIERLLEDAALASDQDSLIINEEKKADKNSVRLMTVHASKGLEFKNVFVVGLEDGLFPNRRDGETKNAEDGEEERRLFYVALTRAKEKLFLTFANYRTIFGSRQINAPSEFIYDIPADLLEKEGERDRIKTIFLD